MSHKAHHPTGRIALESVIRTCILEYGVIPLREDWEDTLALRQGDFEIYRTAVDALAQIGGAALLPVFLDALTDRSQFAK